MTPNGKVSFYNHYFYEQFDLNLDNAKLDDWVSLIHPDDKTQFSDNVDEHLTEEPSEDRVLSQYRVLKKDGSYCWIEAVGVMKRDESGEYMVGNHRDISSQKRLESSIRRLAYYDKTSGLPNHDQLKIDLEKRTSNVILINIHLDGIKSYINQYGEPIIDEVIGRIIKCLKVYENYESKYYRSSIDTFSVLITSTFAEEHLKELCQDFISHFSIASNQNGALYAGGVSIGAYPCHDLKQKSESVINWAAQTCEYAYRNEPCHWAICNVEVQKKVERYFFIESQIKSAIENDDISVRFQPIVCSRTHELTSFEALARWENSSLGEIYPDEFIPVAERKGLIVRLGEKVLTQASSFIAYYNIIWGSDIKVNVNVSVLQLLDGSFPKKAADIVQEEGVSPKNVVLELTESVLLDDKYQAMTRLRKLETLGFELAMDDFGSGHSSIIGFFKLPFQHLKIDKELVNESMREKEPLEYLRFLTTLCSNKGIDVTIEGIETVEMLEQFIEMDVSSLQGYLISRPLALEDAMRLKSDFKALDLG